ncbi:TNF receptor-associated factor 6-like [Rhipicephalus sanguineus]|uniref:TNF receptor-associated factor 6-like n=1 Tax=Rhipicephalus sanguineus TaxID=34632 RepID=UPI00189473CF|nr:TNF receptor-associated factor 6-like [Rhipicephalus sanguineus]
MTQRYTLVGFTEDLDWKPLQFVTPLPENRLCSVCGLVRKTTALLPCGHVLCHSCFQKCWATEEHACPIDGKCCAEEDVEWRDFPAENLLKREVKCWNEIHGCTLQMAAAEVHKHFLRECEYHCTPCPRCLRMVLIRNMSEHLRASCQAVTTPVPIQEMIGDTVQTDMLEGVRRLLQEAGEMKALLQRALGENGAINDSLMEVCQSVNSLKESVKQEIAPLASLSEVTHCVLDGISTLHGSLNSEMADLKMQAEELPRVRAAIESTKTILEIQKKALAYAEKNETRCDFLVPGIQSLEASALQDGNSVYAQGQVYLRGYNMSPGVKLTRNEESVSVDLRLQLHRGDHDDLIQWPFEQKIRFTIVHPLKNEEKFIILKTCRHLEFYKKPTSLSNQGVFFPYCFKLGDLKSGGYVCDDKLRVIVELL